MTILRHAGPALDAMIVDEYGPLTFPDPQRPLVHRGKSKRPSLGLLALGPGTPARFKEEPAFRGRTPLWGDAGQQVWVGFAGGGVDELVDHQGRDWRGRALLLDQPPDGSRSHGGDLRQGHRHIQGALR